MPPDHAHKLLESAREKFPHHAFIVTCLPSEKMFAVDIARGIDQVIISSDLHAEEIVGLLSHADLCVGVASGVTHIAAHLDVPAVVLCNLSDPCWLPSYNPNVTLLAERTRCGCNGDKTGDCNEITPGGMVYRCLYDIKTQSIIDAMQTHVFKKL